MATRGERLITELFQREVIHLEDGGKVVHHPLAEDEEAFLVDYDRLLSEEDLGAVDLDVLGPLLDEFGACLGAGEQGIPTGFATGIAESGIAPCAWYQPIHFFGYDWGIFIREECVLNLARTIACFTHHTAATRTAVLQLIRAAFLFYYYHEHFHHKVESFGIRLWVAEELERYVRYKRRVYRPTYLTDANLEEALANADAYNRFRSDTARGKLAVPVRDAVRDALRWMFRNCAGGYRKAIDYLGADYYAGRYKLQAQIQAASLQTPRSPGDWEFAPRMTQSFLNIGQNIWTVVQRAQMPLLPRRQVAPIRTPSSRDMEQHLRNLGYERVQGGKGSHKKFKKPDAPTIILPANRERLSPGVARNVATALGLGSVGELMKLV